jgi:hypothetical protein
MNTEKNNYECKKEKRRKEGEKVKKKKKRRKGQQSVTANAWPPLIGQPRARLALQFFFARLFFFFFFFLSD